MCGRYALYTPRSAIAEKYFGIERAIGDQIARPIPRGLLEAYPVSTAFNSVRNNGPELIERALA